MLDGMAVMTEDEIAQLTPEERLALIGRLWDSLDQRHVALTDAQREELDRRLDHLDEERERGIGWEELRAELEQRCPAREALLPETPRFS